MDGAGAWNASPIAAAAAKPKRAGAAMELHTACGAQRSLPQDRQAINEVEGYKDGDAPAM